MIRKLFLKLMFVFIVIGAFASLIFCYEYLYVKTPSHTSVVIPRGYTAKDTAKLLIDKGVISNPYVFIMTSELLKFFGKNIIAGEYFFTAGINLHQLMKLLHYGKVTVRKVMIPEGSTIEEVFEILRKAKGVNHTQIDVDEFPEGSILPDTYYYVYGTNDYDLLIKMKKLMHDFLDEAWEGRDKEKAIEITTKEEALILASIVQKEAILTREKPIIAKVYLNRLSHGMLLQADPTVIYGISKWKDFNRKLYFKDLKTKSDYNTYINHGLPPTPICNPGKESVLAVLNPGDTKALYFVANKKGGHLFAENFKQHRANIAIVRKVK